MMDNILHYTSVSHANSVMAVINKMRLETDLCDVVVVIGNFRINAHRVILSASAPFFYQLLRPQLPLARIPEYCLDDVDVTAALKIIEFCYTSAISVDESCVWQLLSASTKLECQEISQLCWEFLSSELDASSCLHTLLMASRSNYDKIMDTTREFLRENLEKVCNSASLRNLTSQDILELVESLRSYLPERDLMKLLRSWMGQNISVRRHVATRLCEEFPQYRQYLQDYISNDMSSHDVQPQARGESTHMTHNSSDEKFSPHGDIPACDGDQENGEHNQGLSTEGVPLHICVSCGDVLDSQTELQLHQETCTESAQPLARKRARHPARLCGQVNTVVKNGQPDSDDHSTTISCHSDILSDTSICGNDTLSGRKRFHDDAKSDTSGRNVNSEETLHSSVEMRSRSCVGEDNKGKLFQSTQEIPHVSSSQSSNGIPHVLSSQGRDSSSVGSLDKHQLNRFSPPTHFTKQFQPSFPSSNDQSRQDMAGDIKYGVQTTFTKTEHQPGLITRQTSTHTEANTQQDTAHTMDIISSISDSGAAQLPAPGVGNVENLATKCLTRSTRRSPSGNDTNNNDIFQSDTISACPVISDGRHQHDRVSQEAGRVVDDDHAGDRRGNAVNPHDNSSGDCHVAGVERSENAGLSPRKVHNGRHRMQSREEITGTIHSIHNLHDGQTSETSVNTSHVSNLTGQQGKEETSSGQGSQLSFQCQICGKALDSRRTLAKHWKQVHGLDQQTDSTGQSSPSATAYLPSSQNQKDLINDSKDDVFDDSGRNSKKARVQMTLDKGTKSQRDDDDDDDDDNDCDDDDMKKEKDNGHPQHSIMDYKRGSRESISHVDTPDLLNSYLEQYRQFTQWCLAQGPSPLCEACQTCHPSGSVCPRSNGSQESPSVKLEEGKEDSWDDTVNVDVVGDSDEEGPLDMSKNSQDFSSYRFSSSSRDRQVNTDASRLSPLDLSHYYTNYALLMAAAAASGGSDRNSLNMPYSEAVSQLRLMDPAGNSLYKPYLSLPTTASYPLNLTSDPQSSHTRPSGDNSHGPSASKDNSCHDVSMINSDLTPSQLSQRRKAASRQGFPCTVCNRVFSYQAALFTHMRTHSPSARTYQCQLCRQSFARAPDLKVHVCPNGVEKPYTCPSCGQTFAKNIHLKRHLATHSGVKPYPCWVCGKRFSRSDHLKRHAQSIHAGSRPHGCQICGKEFVRKYELNKHMLIHSLDSTTGSTTLLHRQRDSPALQQQDSPVLKQQHSPAVQ